MFKKLETPSYPLGIKPFRSLDYAWRGAYLRGLATVQEAEPHEVNIYAGPDIEKLRALDAAPGQYKGRSSLAGRFNNRGLTIHLGVYESLEESARYIQKLETLYEDILREHGAEDRILRDGRLQPAESPTAAESFGDALRRARAEEIHALLREGKPIPFRQMTGRLFRPLANALNISYREELERTQPDNEYVSLTHIYDKLAIFTFLSNGDDDFPTAIRSSWNENTQKYCQTWSGPATIDNLRRHIYGWLADALQERLTPEDTDSPPKPIITAISKEEYAQIMAADPEDVARNAYNYAPTRAAPQAAKELLDRIVPPKAPFLRIVK